MKGCTLSYQLLGSSQLNLRFNSLALFSVRPLGTAFYRKTTKKLFRFGLTLILLLILIAPRAKSVELCGQTFYTPFISPREAFFFGLLTSFLMDISLIMSIHFGKGFNAFNQAISLFLAEEPLRLFFLGILLLLANFILALSPV